MDISFSLHGVLLKIRACDLLSQNVLGVLREDFRFFEVTEEGTESPSLNIILRGRKHSRKFSHSLFKTKMAGVHGWGSHRVCDYGDGTVITARNQKRRRVFQIQSGDQDLLYEVTYTAVLSMIGEALDQRGFHRVHGAAFEWHGKTVLMILPSGGGKSALSTLLMDLDGVKIFSDESPLVKSGKVYPFPIRIALRPEVATALGLDIANLRRFHRKFFNEKVLIPIPVEKVASPHGVDLILVGGHSHEHPSITTAKKPEAFASFLKSMVIGVGLAQMTEHMIRGTNTFDLAGIARSRFSEAWGLAQKKTVYKFNTGPRAQDNFAALTEFLQTYFQ